jgi:hypothetical protein
LFLTDKEMALEESNPDRNRTTNLLDYNIAAERVFKMKVLDFLNDG